MMFVKQLEGDDRFQQKSIISDNEELEKLGKKQYSGRYDNVKKMGLYIPKSTAINIMTITIITNIAGPLLFLLNVLFPFGHPR